MYQFLQNNRDELIARCVAAVAHKPSRRTAEQQLRSAIPLFLEHLTRTLRDQEAGPDAPAEPCCGCCSGGHDAPATRARESTAAYGRQLVELGYTVDQVVHDYGDLCEAITALAQESNAGLTIEELKKLTRGMDEAIATDLSEFSAEREVAVARRQSYEVNRRVGFMVHELRNSLQTATLALRVLESTNASVSGAAAGGVLKRSLTAMTSLLKDSVAAVRATARSDEAGELFSLSAFVADAASAAALDAAARGCTFIVVGTTDPDLALRGKRELLLAALVNLLQNAMKFTRRGTEVSLHVHAGQEGLVDLEVADHCGGLPPGAADTLFRPFTQAGEDRSGLGLGLSIARQSVEADGGRLAVRDVPGKGCVFTMSLPAHRLPSVA